MTRLPASIPKSLAPAANRFALLWLAVALLFQGFVTQTHGHIGLDRAWTATESVRVATAITDTGKDIPATPACPLCEERALFGAYLLGGSAAITVPLATAYHFTPASFPLLALSASSHAWQSRAPPTFTA